MYNSFLNYRMSSRNVYFKAAKESARVLNNLDQNPCCSYASPLSHTHTENLLRSRIDTASSDFSSDSSSIILGTSLGFKVDNDELSSDKDCFSDSDIEIAENDESQNQEYDNVVFDSSHESEQASKLASSLAGDLLMFSLIFHPGREAIEFLLKILTKHGVAVDLSHLEKTNNL